MTTRRTSTLLRFVAGLALAACASLALAAGPAGKPLPPDSIYQLALPLTDQAGVYHLRRQAG